MQLFFLHEQGNAAGKEPWFEDPLAVDFWNSCWYIPYIASYAASFSLALCVFYVLSTCLCFAVLVTAVVRTRLRDMEALMKAEEQQPKPPASSTDTNSALLDSAPELELIQEDKRSI